MSFINCKVESKLKWANYCILSATGNDNNINENANANNIIFTIKDTKLYVPVVTLSAKDNQKLSKLVSKGFERSFYWNECKTKSGDKNKTNKFRYFLESNFIGINRLFVLVYSNRNDDVKRFNAKRYYLTKGIIKNYNVIINGKNIYDQPTDSGIKRCEEIRKLTTGQVEDYTTRFLLGYNYIKNHHILIAVDLSRQKELDADPKSSSTNRIHWTIEKTR